MKPLSPPALRSTLSRMAVTGVAVVASVVAVAPAAVAAEGDLAPADTSSEGDTTPEPPAAEPAPEETPAPDPEPAPSPEPAAPVEEAPAPEVDAPAPPADEVAPPTAEAGTAEAPVASAEDAEVFVAQRITASVRINDSAYVQPGTSTVGSQITLTVTDAGGVATDTVCTTEASTLVGTESFCLFDDGDGGTTTTFDVPAGSSVNVAQTGGTEGLPVSSNSTFIPPMSETRGEIMPIVFDNFGPAPIAATDQVETLQGVSIDIDVLANDESDDPGATIALGSDFDPSTAPDHGTAELVSGTATSTGSVGIAVAGGQQIRYTPDEDYTGGDEFKYSVTNANGTTFGTVFVSVTAAGDVEPNFGTQKYRIGAQIDSGAYVPAGTSTAGSTFTITTTNADGTTDTDSCSSVSFGGGPSACIRDINAGPFGDYYTAPAGATVTITQATVGDPALLPSTETIVIKPCDTNKNECGDKDATFTDKGAILPVTAPDSATVTEGDDPIVVDVLANDTSEDPRSNLSLVTDLPASKGKARVVGEAVPVPDPVPVPDLSRAAAVPAAGTLAIEYTPPKDFTGDVPIVYSLSNSNGATQGTLTVRVKDGKVVTAPDDADDDGAVSDNSASDNATLPDTGGPNANLLALAAMMVAAGGALLARGRRRQA